MILPILITVVSSAAYHFTLKQVSTKGSLFGTLFWSYLISAILCLVFASFSKTDSIMAVDFKDKYQFIGLLSLTLIGIEMGYLLAYKSGGNLGHVSMIAHALSMILLLGIGLYLSKDAITVPKVLGIISGIVSFALLAR